MSDWYTRDPGHDDQGKWVNRRVGGWTAVRTFVGAVLTMMTLIVVLVMLIVLFAPPVPGSLP